jgi:hypothetical protein
MDTDEKVETMRQTQSNAGSVYLSEMWYTEVRVLAFTDVGDSRFFWAPGWIAICDDDYYLDSVGAFTVQSIYITGGTPASSEPPQHKTTTSAATTSSSRSSSPASRTGGYPCHHHANFGPGAGRTADEGGRAGESAPTGPMWDVAIDPRAVHNAPPVVRR